MHYLQAVLAYVLWGIFPLYWKLLKPVNAFEVICHRIVWSLVTLLICITVARQWNEIRALRTAPKRIALCGLAAVLISINWLVFIWAVQNGYIVEGSLGYFINPLLNVLLGVLIFGERLNWIQWSAIVVAAIGVSIMAISTGSIPWIALSLAISFAFYAAVKKKTTLPAIAGLGMETAILLPLSLGYIGYLNSQNASTVPDQASIWILLMMGGPITTVPLLLFAAAAKKVPMIAMGMLQYIAPTIQFLLGLLLFKEAVDRPRMIGFGCVWTALLILSVHAYVRSRVEVASTTDSTPTTHHGR